jgi:hypothetical protein
MYGPGPQENTTVELYRPNFSAIETRDLFYQTITGISLGLVEITEGAKEGPHAGTRCRSLSSAFQVLVRSSSFCVFSAARRASEPSLAFTTPVVPAPQLPTARRLVHRKHRVPIQHAFQTIGTLDTPRTIASVSGSHHPRLHYSLASQRALGWGLALRQCCICLMRSRGGNSC